MEDKKRKKRHKTAPTSREAFKELNKTGKRNKQTVLVFQALKRKSPQNSRELSLTTGIERTAITRVLHDAVHTSDPLIRIGCLKPCRFTKRKVQHYQLVG